MISDAWRAVALFAPVLTTALLLPPHADTSSHTTHSSASPGLLNIDPKFRSIILPCPACPGFLDAEHAPAVADDAEDDDDTWLWLPDTSNVALNFRVSYDERHLELNGETIYPPEFPRSSPFRRPVYVDPVPIHSELVEPLEVTASALRIEQEHRASEHGDVVVPIKYRILTLNSQRMTDLPEISLDLLQTGNGELFILKLDTHDSPELDLDPLPNMGLSAHRGDGGECKSWLSFFCELKSALSQKWNALRHGSEHSPPQCPEKSSPAHLSSHIRPYFDKDGQFHHQHYHDHHHYHPGDSPRQFGAFSDHHDHGHGHHVLHAVLRGLIGALIPILAGITVGLSVSFLGLAAGRLIGWTFTRLSRRGRNACHDQYTRVALDDAEAQAFYEGKLLSEEDEIDIPPAYERAPAYDEID